MTSSVGLNSTALWSNVKQQSNTKKQTTNSSAFNEKLPRGYYDNASHNIEYLERWKDNKIGTGQLSEKEAEIFKKIQDKVSSALGVSTFLYDGVPKEHSRGLAIFATGFPSSDISSPFVTCQRYLASLAKDEKELDKFMQRLDDMISLKKKNNSVSNNTNEDAERKLHQMRLNMMSFTDFWNESKEDAPFLSHSIQSQITQQMINRYEQMSFVH